MNIRCSFCQTPYAIGRAETVAALQYLETEKLTHYDAHCPRCRRATPILRQQLEQSVPNWRDALQELEKQAEAAPASTPQPEAAPAPKTEVTPQPAHAKHHRTRAGAKAKEMAKASAPKKAVSPKGKKSA